MEHCLEVLAYLAILTELEGSGNNDNSPSIHYFSSYWYYYIQLTISGRQLRWMGMRIHSQLSAAEAAAPNGASEV